MIPNPFKRRNKPSAITVEVVNPLPNQIAKTGSPARVSPYYDVSIQPTHTYEMIKRLRSAGYFHISDEFLAEIRTHSAQRLPPHGRS